MADDLKYPTDDEAVMRDLIRESVFLEVEDKLTWNVTAYGKAWTGEGEDTDFIVHGVADAVVERLRDCGYEIRRVAGHESAPESSRKLP